MDHESDYFNRIALPDDWERILRSQVIDQTHPGSILADFGAFLDFIGPKGIEVSKKNNVLSGDSLASLNAGLSRPLDIRLKRPRQRSYPNINGLYLLLRASGFAYPEQRDGKLLMTLDEAAMQSWEKSNFTERYFTLFESWLVRGHPQIVGESRSSSPFYLLEWVRFFTEMTDRELRIPTYVEQRQMVHHYPGLLNVALLDLFGIISVRSVAPDPGEGWRIAGIRRTPYGDALLQLMMTVHSKKNSLFWLNANKFEESFGMLQPFMEPVFPEWRTIVSSHRPCFWD